MITDYTIEGRSGRLTPGSVQPPVKEEAVFSPQVPARVAPALGVVAPEVGLPRSALGLVYCGVYHEDAEARNQQNFLET